MIFSAALIGKVLDGSKTQTRRPVKAGMPRSVATTAPCRYKAGQTYAIQPGRGEKSIGRLRVLEVSRERIRAITDADAEAEGFDSPVSFIGWWADRYGSAALLGECWRIRFELA